MSRDRYRIHDASRPHFLTCTVVGWLPVFTRPEAAAIVLDSWRFLQAHGRLALYGYVVMENHLHFVASATDLVREVQAFKGHTARQVIDFLRDRGDHSLLDGLERLKLRHHADCRYQLWQEGSHPVELSADAVMLQKLEYIHNNPVRRGYVDAPEDWRYSSARNYAGRPGLIPVTTDWR